MYTILVITVTFYGSSSCAYTYYRMLRNNILAATTDYNIKDGFVYRAPYSYKYAQIFQKYIWQHRIVTATKSCIYLKHTPWLLMKFTYI